MLRVPLRAVGDFGGSIGLDLQPTLWEIPNMVTVKADEKQRVRLPDIKPGQVFIREISGDVITLTPVKPAEDDVPVVKPIRRRDGTYRFPANAKPSRKAILAAIRADRDRDSR